MLTAPNSRRAITFVLFAALVIGAVGFGGSLLLTRRMSARTASLSIGNLDIGNVWAQDALKWPIRVVNHTNRDLHLDRLEASCHCLAVDPPSFRVPAHGSTVAVLTISVGSQSPTERPDARRSFSFIIVPILKGERPQGRFVLRGTVRNPLAFSANDVFFSEDDAASQANAAPSRVVSFEAAVPLKSIGAFAEPPYATALIIRDGTTRGTITIAPARHLTAGRFQCDLVVSGVSEAGERLPAVRLPVAGVVTRDIHPVPGTLWFPPAPLGSHVQGSILIASRTGTRFSVDSVWTSTKDVVVEAPKPPSLRPNTYTICAHVRVPGRHSEVVEFLVTSGRVGRQRIRFSVNYVGLPMQVQ